MAVSGTILNDDIRYKGNTICSGWYRGYTLEYLYTELMLGKTPLSTFDTISVQIRVRRKMQWMTKKIL